MRLTTEFKNLVMNLSNGALTGNISLAAIAGLFKTDNALLIAIPLIVGPGALLSAALLEGAVKERLLAALTACSIATALILLAATLGSSLLSHLNINILKIVGGVAIIVIGLLVMGVKISDNLPLMIMIGGVIIAIVMR